MGEVLKFGPKQVDVEDEPVETGDIEKGLDKLVDYLARNCSIEVGMAILDITKEITDAARSDGYMAGSGSWYSTLIKAFEDDVISEDAYAKLLEIYTKLMGGNADGAE